MSLSDWWYAAGFWYGLRHPLYEDAWPRLYVEIQIGRFKCWRRGHHLWKVYREPGERPSRYCSSCETFEFTSEEIMTWYDY